MLITENEKSPSYIYVNVKKGLLVYKNEKGEILNAESIKGKIIDVDFFIDDFKGTKKEKLKLYIKSENDIYILQMDVDSGYFRSLCNCLKNADFNFELQITPKLSYVDNKPRTSCFVQQNGKYLKHYFNKNFMGLDNDILPNAKIHKIGNNEIYDFTDMNIYYKNYLKQKVKKNGI